MQSVTQTVEIVSYVTGIPSSRVGQIARALLNAYMLPKSSGRDVKKIGGDGLLLLLAATAMADKAVDAAQVAAAFAVLPAHGPDGEVGNPLPHWFKKLIELPNSAAEIEFAKVATGYTANLTMYFGDDDGETKALHMPFWQDESWGHFCKSSFTLSREGFEVLRNLFVREDIDGMSFKLMNNKDAE